MARKTYGVSGLIEWTANIKAGKTAVIVHFTGGATTSFGITPAKYTTENPFFQAVIEGSEEYRKGKIALLSTIGEEAPKPQPAQPKPEPEQAENADKNTGFTQVEVADKADAIEWLKEHHPEKGYNGAKLRSKEAFNAACDECSVQFIFSE